MNRLPGSDAKFNDAAAEIAPTTARPMQRAEPMQRAQGTGRLSSKFARQQTVIDTLRQSGCAKILLPRTHASHLEAVLINTSGGLTDGDQLLWDIGAGPQTHVVVTTQACERVYRSLGGPAQIETRVSVAEDAHVMWFPQETILFDHAHLERRLEVDLAHSARFTAIEIVLFGRQAMRERGHGAKLADHWRIRRAGRLVHADATRVTGAPLERAANASLAGHVAMATLLHIGEDAPRRAAEIAPFATGSRTLGLSAGEHRLVVRALASSGLAMRRQLTPILAALSATGALPRLWST